MPPASFWELRATFSCPASANGPRSCASSTAKIRPTANNSQHLPETKTMTERVEKTRRTGPSRRHVMAGLAAGLAMMGGAGARSRQGRRSHQGDAAPQVAAAEPVRRLLRRCGQGLLQGRGHRLTINPGGPNLLAENLVATGADTFGCRVASTACSPPATRACRWCASAFPTR